MIRSNYVGRRADLELRCLQMSECPLSLDASHYMYVYVNTRTVDSNNLLVTIQYPRMVPYDRVFRRG